MKELVTYPLITFDNRQGGNAMKKEKAYVTRTLTEPPRYYIVRWDGEHPDTARREQISEEQYTELMKQTRS